VSLVLAASAAACTGEPANVAGPSTSSSLPAPPPERTACEIPLPAAWQQAIENNRVVSGASTMPLAVGPAGEVVAVRDNGDTRDVLLIGADKSVKEI